MPAICVEIIKRRKHDNAHGEAAAEKMIALHGGDGGFLFPGINADGAIGPIADLRQQVHEGTKHTRFPVEDVHTLRRTFESIAHEEGVSEMDTHVLSNHSFSSHNVNATYISQHMDHLRACQRRIEAGLRHRLKLSK